jgi:hypothetical protein
MSKKLKIMSLSVEPEMQELLKNSSKKMGCSVSSLVRDLVDKHIDLIVNDGEEIPVILKIPTSLRGNPEDLKVWLDSRVSGIVKALSK